VEAELEPPADDAAKRAILAALAGLDAEDEPAPAAWLEDEEP
jgi:hypothetical protein